MKKKFPHYLIDKLKFHWMFAFLFFIVSLNSFGQCTVSDLNGLVTALNNASITEICITNDIDVTTVAPLAIRPGVTLRGAMAGGGGVIEGWMDPLCPTITCRKRWKNTLTNDDQLENAFVFVMLPCTTGSCNPTTIKDLKIKGEEYHWQDFNDQNWLSGGIFIKSRCTYQGTGCYTSCSENNNSQSCEDCIDCLGRNFVIENCEISGFNYAGIHCQSRTSDITIVNNYIHNIKGIRTTIDVNNSSNPEGHVAIAYGIWIQTSKYPTEVNLLNNIFDDCKAAIDGQSGAADWNISDCTFSQFFLGSINKHNGFEGMIADPKPVSGSFPCNGSTCLFYDRQPPGINACNPFDVNDLAGGNPTIEKCIFHKPLNDDGLGGCANFPYPFSYSVFRFTHSNTLSVPSPVHFLCNAGSEVHSNGETFLPSGTLDNGIWVNVPVGFNFDFMGIEYNTISVSTNGFIQFGTLSLADNSVSHKLPNSNPPNNYIAFCATDLHFNDPGSYIKYGKGTTPAGQSYFVIEFHNAIHSNTSITGTISARIVLFDKILSGAQVIETGKIEVYIDVAPPSFAPLPPQGKPVLGVENFSGKGGVVATARNAENSWNGATVEAWRFMPQNYTITFRNNTTTAQQSLPSGVNYNMGGYLKVADNFIESCPWTGNQNFDVGDNTFNYNPSNPSVLNDCPLPPVFSFDLLDNSGSALPVTGNSPPIKYVDPGAVAPIPNILIHAVPASNQQHSYFIRTNPNNKNVPVNNVSSENNYFDYEIIEANKTISNPLNHSYQYTEHGTTNWLPGLYGVDLMALHETNSSVPYWKEKMASAWHNQPLIVKPAEPMLIFNIKDSYKTKIDNATGLPIQSSPQATGILKQVEINGIPVWREDIAFGGDGWERVALSLNDETVFKALAPGGKNKISFSIALEEGMVVSSVDFRGVSVWVDDVYINGFDNAADNLIADGTIELSPFLKTRYQNNCAACMWYKPANETQLNPVCPNFTFSPEERIFYPDGSEAVSANSFSPYYPSAYISDRERKSGSRSLVLNLPQINSQHCTSYPVGTGLPLISAVTDFQLGFPCNAFSNILPSILSNVILSNQDFTASGTIIITGNVTLDNCRIALEGNITSPVTNIIISDNSTLYLTNGSFLFSCGTGMWKGIELSSYSSTISISGNSKVSDALVAVSAGNGGTVIADHCLFDRNHVSIRLFNSNPGTEADYSDCVIKGARFFCSGGNSLKAPLANNRSRSHIELTDVYDIKIGDEFGDPNYFNPPVPDAFEADKGIYGIRSNALLANNIFHNFNKNTQSSLADLSRQAVLFEGLRAAGRRPAINTITIGTQASGNTFMQCSRAVELINMNATIENNDVSNTYLTTQSGSGGIDYVQQIYVHDSKGSQVTITGNRMKNEDKGINIDCLGNSQPGSINIFANDFIQCLPDRRYMFLSGANAKYHGAIRTAYGFSESSVYAITNNQNIVTTGDFGIHSLGVYLKISENKIYMEHDQSRLQGAINNFNSGNLQDPFFGMRIETCPWAYVNCNLVKGNITTTVDPTLNYQDFQCRHAISTTFSRESWFDCNATDMTEMGMEFLADCDKSIIRGNSFRTHNFGFQLGATFGGTSCTGWSTGIIGDQATMNDGGGPYTLGNKFEGSDGLGTFGMGSMHSANSYAFFNPNNGVFNQWYFHDLNQIYYPPLPPFTLDNCAIANASAFNPFPDPSIQYYTCQTCPNLQPGNSDEEVEQRIAAINNTDSTAYGTQTPLITSSLKDGLYDFIKKDTALLDSSQMIHDFYFSVKNSSIGKFYEVQVMISKMISDSDSVAAATIKAEALLINNSIPVNYVFEQNQKDMNNIMLNYDGVITEQNLASSDKPIVEGIAWQCPYKGGKAVYTARAIVWKYNPGAKFSDYELCNEGAYFRQTQQLTKPVNTTNISLHPNPAANSVTINYSLPGIENPRALILDVTGRAIKSFLVNSKETQKEIDISGFIPGIYFVKVNADNYELNTLKLTVIK